MPAPLRFHLPPVVYQRVKDWREEIDLQILGEQLERNGKAAVIYTDGRAQKIGTVTQLPARGEATPYYSPVNNAYVFIFSPGAGGDCKLTVINVFANGRMYPVKVVPLVMHLEAGPTTPLAEESKPPGDDIILALRSLSGEYEGAFVISSELMAILETWEAWGRALEEYEFAFTPSSVGTFIIVRHQPSEAVFDLTQYIDL